MNNKISILLLILKSILLIQAENKIHQINDIDSILKGLNNNLGLTSFELISNINSKTINDELCKNQTKQIISKIQKFEIWAMKFVDSWGGIPSGILEGHFTDLGNFEECLSISEAYTTLGTIRGKYCLVNVPVTQIIDTLKPKNNDSTESSNLLSSMKSAKMDIKINIGVCLPEVCSLELIDEAAKRLIENITQIKVNYSMISGQCTEFDEINKSFDAMDWVATVFFSVIVLIIFSSTIYDYSTWNNVDQQKQLFIAFSILTNGSKLFRIETIKSPNIIECLNGIRCLSMVWIIFGHSFLLTAQLNNINPAQMMVWITEFIASIIIQGTVSVDSFFFLSGFLLMWAVCKEMDKTRGKLNVLMMYAHRYIRLTPVLAVAIIFAVSFYRHIGSGPFWKSTQMSFVDGCQENWWATLLYVQNYAIHKNPCMPHGWYLAVDTQLFFFSPLIVIPLYKWGKKFVGVVIVLGLLSLGCVFAITMKYKFNGIMGEMGQQDSKFMRLIYTGTHARYAPWLVGILLAFGMYHLKNQRIRLHKGVVIAGWIISLGTIIAVLFAPYWRKQGNPDIMPVVESAFHASLHRVSWSIALAWIVFACHNGYGGVINSILSFPIWQPFGRLTYSMYIVHFMIQYIVNGNSKTDIHFSEFDVILRFWGDFGLTLTVGIITVLAFESPILGLEKLIFKQRPAQTINELRN